MSQKQPPLKQVAEKTDSAQTAYPRTPAARARAIAASWGYSLPPLSEDPRGGKENKQATEAAGSVLVIEPVMAVLIDGPDSIRPPMHVRTSEISELRPEPETRNPISKTFIRGPKLEVFIPHEPGATMEEALARANAENRVIASNKRMDSALVGSDEWKSVENDLPCWTGTMTAYEKPGKKFGKFVEYSDDKTGIKYVFPVPDEFVGVKNGLLVVEHPDFTLETDGNSRIVRAAKVELIEKFPAAMNNWYLTDPAHGIPFGAEVDSSNKDARWFWRIAKRVGLVARGNDSWSDYGDRRSVHLSYAPSDGFGVAVEAPDGNAASKLKPPPLPRQVFPNPARATEPKLSEEEQYNLDATLVGAANTGDPEDLQKLIDKGANVNPVSLSGRTALMYAAVHGKTKNAELLISNGADPNVKDADGLTALMRAADYGKTETAKMLISKGADVNATNNLGRTALMYAAENGNTEIAEMLIEKGADVKAKDNDGMTALMHADSYGNTKIAKMLKKRMRRGWLW